MGIGSSAPTAKLHLLSSYDANSGTAVKLFYQGTWGTANYATNYRFLDISSTESGKVLQVNGTGIGIGTDAPAFDSPDKLYVNGNVGIGTTSPDANYKLSVNGNIRSKEIKVETGWSDYVFEKRYKLRPLTQVKAFIQQKGHLPDVPSAEEVKANGINLGETQSLLLKKIEELTLYLIEKDKELNLERQERIRQGARLKAALKKLESKLQKNEPEIMRFKGR